MVSYDESVELLNSLSIEAKALERLSIDMAYGRVLACDIIASEPNPKYKTSAMDGYAIKFEDIGSRLKIVNENPAGSVVESSVDSGTTIKTFTGSLMPEGSDTLIPIEYVDVYGEYIEINKHFPKGFSVRDIGENYNKDEVLIKSNTILDFAHIGVLASLNISFVSVYKKPQVAILSTGSEILDVGDIQTNEAQIRSSNHFTISAIAQKYGANTTQMGVVKDNYETIKNKIRDALVFSDIVVTTGGVSVGDYDFVKNIIKKEIGANIVFKGVLIKPGQHVILAKKDNKYILGLPGFAYSSSVTALLYLAPLIKKFMNQKANLEYRKAILDDKLVKRSNKTEFTVANLEYKNLNYRVNFKNKKIGTSAILTNMLGNIVLVKSLESDTNKDIGEEVSIILI